MSIEPLVITLTGEAESAKSAARQTAESLDGVVASAKSVGVEAAKAGAALAKMEAKAAREAATALRATATEAQDVAKKATDAAKALDGADGRKAKEAAVALMQTAKEASNAAREAEKTAVALERVEASKVREVTQEVAKLAEAERKAKQELEGISGKFREVGESVPGSKSFQAFQTGIGGMKLQIADVRAAMKELRDSGAGGKYGPDPALLGRGADAAALLSRNLEGVRNVAIGVSGTGIGGLMGLNSFIANSEEGRGIETREDSLFASQQAKGMRGAGDRGTVDAAIDSVRTKSHAADDDPIREAAVQMASDQVATKDLPDLLEAAARNAETLKTPIDQVGEGMAKAYGELSLSRLTKMNILFDEGAQEAVDAAAAISKTAGQTEFMRQVMASTAKSTGELGSGLTDTQKAANDFSNSFDSLSTNVGAGAGIVKAQVSYLGGALIEVANSAPGLEKVAGGLGYIGSGLLAAGGSGIALVSQLGQMVLGFNALKTAYVEKTAAAAADTTVITTNTVATTGAGAAAVSSSLEFDALAAAEGNAAAAADVNTVAQEAQAVATAEGAAAAGGLSLGTLGVAAAAGAAVVAFGTWVMSGIYGMNQMNLKLSEQRTLLESVSDGWASIKDYFTGGSSAEMQVNQRQLEKGMAEVDYNAAADVTSGKKSQATADKDALDAKIKAYDAFAKEDLRIGDRENLVKNQHQLQQLKQQRAAMDGPAAMPPMPAMPPVGVTAAPLAPVAAPTANATPSALPASPAATTPGQSSALESQIRALEDQKAGADKDKKKALTEQIRLLKRQQSDAKKAEAAATKKQNIADREAKAAAKVQDADDLALAKAKDDIASSKKIEQLQGELDAAKEAKNAAEVGRITLAIEVAKAEREYADKMAAADQNEAGKHRQTLEEIARVELNADLNRARATAKKAQDGATQSDGKSDSAKRDAAIRQTLAAMHYNVGSASGSGFSALNPAGQMGDGDRYKLSGDWQGTPVALLQSMTPRVYRSGAASSGYGPGANAPATSLDDGWKEISRSQRMNSKGDTVTKIELEITSAYQGLGSARRRLKV